MKGTTHCRFDSDTSNSRPPVGGERETEEDIEKGEGRREEEREEEGGKRGERRERMSKEGVSEGEEKRDVYVTLLMA